jgi:hypothetical protein
VDPLIFESLLRVSSPPRHAANWKKQAEGEARVNYGYISAVYAEAPNLLLWSEQNSIGIICS